MSTKAQVQAAIDAIGTGQANTAAEVRAAYQIIADELFSVPVLEVSFGTHSNTTPNVNFSYRFTLKKRGNECVAYGFVRNLQPTPFESGSEILAFSNSLYNARTGFSTVVKNENTGSSINFNGNKILVGDEIGGYEQFYFETTYLLND